MTDLFSDNFSPDTIALSAALDGNAPGGSNLEYDPLFLELEQAAAGKPEVQYGTSVSAEVPADWGQVQALAMRLMERSRDLRLAVWLARALLNLRGVAGFAAGLQVVAELLDSLWDHVHPQLDAEDDNDPSLRVNILAALSAPGSLLRELRDAPLVGVRGHGSFSLRDLDMATGELPTPAGQEAVSLAVIDAAFRSASQTDLAATTAALRSALANSARIEQILTERVGSSRALDMSALSNLLRRAAQAVSTRMADPAAAPEAAESGHAGLADSPGTALALPVAQPSGDITSRDDVRRALDKLCAYYARHEPSSPVPLLLQRAHKLVDMSFTELLQDLAPEGLGQLAKVSGIRNDS